MGAGMVDSLRRIIQWGICVMRTPASIEVSQPTYRRDRAHLFQAMGDATWNITSLVWECSVRKVSTDLAPIAPTLSKTVVGKPSPAETPLRVGELCVEVIAEDGRRSVRGLGGLDQFEVTKASDTTVLVSPGIWLRESMLSGTRHARDTEFDVVALSGVATSDPVIIYALLVNGNGASGWNPSSVAEDSADFVNAAWGGNGIELVFLPAKIFGARLAPHIADAQGQLVPLAMIQIDSGDITSIEQIHKGAIIKDDPLSTLGEVGTSAPGASDVGFNLSYTALDTPTLDMALYKSMVISAGGKKFIGNALVDQIPTADLVDNADLTVYVENVTDTVANDPALNPEDQTAAIKWYASGASPYDAKPGRMQYRLLKIKRHGFDVGGGGKFWMYEINVLQHGPAEWFYARPDGSDSDLDSYDVVPRMKTLGYNSLDVESGGELQDHNAYETIVQGSSVAQFDGDDVMAYYDYLTTGITLKKYARVDTSNAASWDKFASLEVYNSKFQIRGFQQAPVVGPIDFSTASALAWQLMVRRVVGSDTYVDYVEASTAKVADSAHSDEADFATDGNWTLPLAVNHGDLAGLDDNSDHPWTWCNESPADTFDTRNTAASGILTDHLRTPLIKTQTGEDSVDVVNRRTVDSSGGDTADWEFGHLYYYNSVVVSFDWFDGIANDKAANQSADFDNRLLKNAAGTTVLNWNTGDLFTTGVGVARQTDAITADTTLDATNHVVTLDATAGAVTATLPAAPVDGQEFQLTCVNADNAVTIGRNGNTLFGEAADFVLYEGESLSLRYSTANGWWQT